MVAMLDMDVFFFKAISSSAWYSNDIAHTGMNMRLYFVDSLYAVVV